MRQWNVDPRLLCRRHLLGEHVETHMIAAALVQGRRLDGYVENGLIEVSSLRARHRSLAAEMARRGYRHRSPLRPFRWRRLGAVDSARNLRELARRCTDCRRRIHGAVS